MGRVGAVLTDRYNLESNNVVLEPETVRRLADEKITATFEQFKKMNGGQLKLEVGSGIRPKPGYLHLDMEVGKAKPNIDFSCDFADNKLPSDIFDEVIAIHFLEHVFWMKCPWIMSEFNRVLKTGGKLFLEVPDYDVASKHDHTKAHLFFETVYMNSRGDGDVSYNDFTTGFNHASTWNENFLTRLAIATGFEVKRRPDLEGRSVHNWIGVLYLECTKVSKPMTSGNANAQIKIFDGDNTWIHKYKEAYGV